MHAPACDFDVEVLFVDGENVSKLDIATIKDLSRNVPRRLIYQTDAAAKKAGYPGFEHVVVHRIGKESVDKAIAMDVVSAWHQGVRKVALMSNDHDYGATALHIKSRHPEMDITLVCDEHKVSRHYLAELMRHGVKIQRVPSDEPLNDFACQVLEVIYELARRNCLTLPMLGSELAARGIAYKHLKKELIKNGVATDCGVKDLTLTTNAQRHLNKTHRP